VLVYIDGELIETTAEHPFYTDEGEWIAAAALTVGEAVRTLSGEYGTVENVQLIAADQPMYNLTVAEAHTFFVGEDGWLVHNCSAPAPGEVIDGRYVGDPKEVFNSPKPISGIYEYKDQTGNWYVGKAEDLHARMKQHLAPNDPHVLASVDEFVFTPLPYNKSARTLEIGKTIRVLQLRNMGYTVNNDGLLAQNLWPRMRQRVEQVNGWPQWLLDWED
jgi:hypothetical protein